MSITIEIESPEIPEQINDSVEYIFSGIKSILEKDELGIFNLRSKRKIDDEVERVDDQIQQMIVASQERNEKNSKLSSLVQQLKTGNQTKAQTLINRINSNAD